MSSGNSRTLVALLLVLLLAVEFHSVEAWSRSRAKRVFVLPEGEIQPESITTDGAGRFWASLYNPAGTGAGKIVTFTTSQLKLKSIVLSGGPSTGVAGIHYRKTQKDLLLVDNVQANIYSVDPTTGASTLFASLPLVKGTAKFPNDLTEDSAGNVYITDSLQGVIFRTGPTGGAVVIWSQDPILSAAGLGVNGIAFSKAFDVLYVSNTGTNGLYAINILSGFVAGTATKLASPYGPDGVRVDPSGNIWVAANAGAEIDVFNSKGLAIDVKGDFEGLDKNNVPQGLIGPAGLAYDGKKNWFIVNAGFPGLGLFDYYASNARRYIISRVSATIPKSLRSSCSS